MVYYNTRKLTLIHQEALHTIIRDINHYTFYLNVATTNNDSIFLDAFVTHLKAGNGNTNAWLRETMADTFVKALQQIPANHHVLLAGDFNFYNNEEPAFEIFTDTTNPIVMVDPLHQPGDWHDNPAFKTIQTQATRKTLSGFGLGGASGGMDDRFDFILMSQNLETDSRLHYIPGTYKAFGNNGDCFNRAINNDSCIGRYSLPLRNLLFQMSDHTPVMMTLAVQGNFPTTAVPDIENPQKPFFYFPEGNVVSETLTLAWKKHKNIRRQFVLYNIFGSALKIITAAEGEHRIKINLSGLASGMYFIRCRQQVARFIKR